MFPTDDGEVERGLSEAVAVPQLDGVAAAVLLLPAGDGQFTAAVTALDGDIRRALLDLITQINDAAQVRHQIIRVCVCVCVCVCVSHWFPEL